MGFEGFDQAAAAALDLLRSMFALEDGGRLQENLFFLETFDWRLHRADFLLSATKTTEGYGLSLDQGRGERPLRATVSVLPGFSTDLPEIIRPALARLMAMRRLLPIIGVRRQIQEAKWLDDEEKTIVRLQVEQTEVISGEGALTNKKVENRTLGLLPGRLRVRSVVGYDEEFERLSSYLQKRILWKPIDKSLFEEALAVVGRVPRDYSSKVRIPLKPEESAVQASRTIHLALLQTLKVNEEGTRLDLDTEFLHDFRVAVRRARSALTQIKGVFPPSYLERFRRELSWLGSCTGPTRDLDVFLLKFDDLKASLPESAGRSLEPLREFLLKEQQREQKRLAAALSSDRYRELIHSWSGFLTHPPACNSDECPNADRPTIDVARERIWKIYRRIVKKGRRVRPETPVEVLHEIRIDGKKLRYLLEFFADIFPEDEIGGPIKALKGLQDNLGDLNDYEVQSRRLEELARELDGEGGAPVETLLAMGRLTHRLDQGKLEEKRKFEEHFAKFDAVANRNLYRKLFRPVRA